MASPAHLKLPFIDFCEALEKGSSAWSDARLQVRNAVEEFGCFEARFNGVSMELRNNILRTVEHLFDLPLYTMLPNASKKPYRGYVNAQLSQYQSLWFDESLAEKVDEISSTLKLEHCQQFGQTLVSYSEKLSQLERVVRKMILESFGVEKYCEEHLKSTVYPVNVIKYDSPDTSDTKVGIRAHTDKNIMTILSQLNQVKGLQLQTKNGEWFSLMPSSPESFIVILGDSISALVNGRLDAPHHRVMVSGTESRYSIGLFATYKDGYVVKAPEELVDEEHPLQFKPFYYSQFLGFYFTEEGQKVKGCPLKAYCGAA